MPTPTHRPLTSAEKMRRRVKAFDAIAKYYGWGNWYIYSKAVKLDLVSLPVPYLSQVEFVSTELERQAQRRAKKGKAK